MSKILKTLTKPFCNHVGGGDGTEVTHAGAKWLACAVLIIIMVVAIAIGYKYYKSGSAHMKTASDRMENTWSELEKDTK